MATYLLNLGHTVTLPKRRMARDFADRAEYADKGDIYASGKRIEVKHIKHDFQYEAWPFETAAICAKSPLMLPIRALTSITSSTQA